MKVIPPSYTEIARACLNCRHRGTHSKRIAYTCQKIQSDTASEGYRIIPAVYGHCAEFEWCEEAISSDPARSHEGA